ncbi:MAG: ABC transporter ATP-binding protein [Bacteroidetes bacterium]|nr:ABC transporter ATP-binding protein [Bacteroidota bacterium]
MQDVINIAINLKKEPVIEVKNLHKSYKDFEAVKGISFTVYKGDVFGFLGPNGAGKSTTIRMLMTLIQPTSGEIRIFGKSLLTDRSNILNKIGAIVEKPDMYGYLSVFDNLKLLSRMSGQTASSVKIMEILELVGLKDRAKSKVQTFSHGMKQRAGIAQALIHDPELIILDEPTTGLDPQGMVEIRDLILRLSTDFKKTILLSSHILNEVELVANRMVIINKGKVAVEGEVETLLNTDDMKVTMEVTAVEKALQLIKASTYQEYYRDCAGNKIIFQIKKERLSDLNRLMVENGVDVISLVPMRSLEEYFLNLT